MYIDVNKNNYDVLLFTTRFTYSLNYIPLSIIQGSDEETSESEDDDIEDNSEGHGNNDLEWIQMAIRTIIHLYENDDSPLQRNHYEYWYTITFFGTCMDILFRDSKLGTDVKRFFFYYS